MYCPSLPPDPPSNQILQFSQTFNFQKFRLFNFTSIFNLSAAIASADKLGWSVESRVTPRSLLTGKNGNRSLLTGKHSIAYHRKRSAKHI